MLLGLFSLVSAAIFFGAAIYINIAEQPARMLLDDKALLQQWQPSYKRGFAMQSALAIIAFLFGLAHWWQSGAIWSLAGGVLMLANWPWTLIAIMPTNTILNSIEPSSGDPRIRPLLAQWNRLHAARTALSGLACICLLAAVAQG